MRSHSCQGTLGLWLSRQCVLWGLFLPLTNWELPLIFGPLPRPRRGKNLILPWVWPQPALLINIPSCFSPVTKEEGSTVWGQQKRSCQEQTSAWEAALARAESVPGFFLFVQFTHWDKSAPGGLNSNLPLPGTRKWVSTLPCHFFSHGTKKLVFIFKVKFPTLPFYFPHQRNTVLVHLNLNLLKCHFNGLFKLCKYFLPYVLD